MAQKEFKKGSFGWFPGAGALHLITNPITVLHEGKMITAATIQFLHPGSRRDAKDHEDIEIKAIKSLPTKENFNSAIKICTQPQEPVSINDLENTVNKLFERGELEDLAKVVSYCRGRDEQFKVYHGHAILALATIKLALRLEERRQAVPSFDSQKWDDLFSSAIGFVEKGISDKTVIITPTIEEQTAQRQQQEFEEELPKLIDASVGVFGDFVEQYAAIHSARNAKGKKAKQAQRDRKAQGLSARPSFSQIELPKAIEEFCAPIFDEIDEQIAFAKWQTAQEQNPLIQYDKDYQVELLNEWADVLWGSGRKNEQREIVKLFKDGQLTFREANLVMSVPFKKRVPDDAVNQALRSEDAAYIYDDEPLTKDNVRKAAFDAASKAINALESTSSDIAQTAKQYLVDWKKPREAEFAPR